MSIGKCAFADVSGGVQNPSQYIEEADTSPSSVYYKLIFPNNSITDNLDGTASLNTVTEAHTTANYLKLDASNDPLTGDLNVGTNLLNAEHITSQFLEVAGYVFPPTFPADNQIFKYDAALGRLAWEADATGGAGGFSVYLEEGDVAKADSSGADLYVDFDSTDFETGVVGNEVNVTIPDDGHLHTGTSLSSIDISVDTNLTAGDALTLTDDDIDFDGGASPSGELGGTWASPTIDDLFLLNSTSDVMVGTLTSDGLTVGTNENLTFGTETLTFDAITSADFELSDDLNINDTDPHIRLVDSNGDDFELWADANQVYLTNYTDAKELLRFDSVYDAFFPNSTSVTFKAEAQLKGAKKHILATIIDPLSTQTEDNEICIWPVTDGSITVTKITVTLDANANEIAGDLKYADTFIGLANATVINAFDTTSGVLVDATITQGLVPSGKCVYLSFDSAPNTAIHQASFDIEFYYN